MSKSKKMKKSSTSIIIFVICIFTLSLCLLFLRKTYDEQYYKIESRSKNIVKTKHAIPDEYTVAGWIRVQGTNIDYPVLGELHEGQVFPVEIEKYAWIQTGDNKYHNVVNIYGHNILNLSSNPIKQNDSFNRFEELMGFLYYDFAKENRYIQLTLDGNDYLYEIFAVGIQDGFKMNFLPIENYTDEELTDYLQLVQESSIYDYDVNVSKEDKFITLVTCTRFYGNANDSLYVAGRLVNKDKAKVTGKVIKNKNYNKIENVLKKGVDENDNKDFS